VNVRPLHLCSVRAPGGGEAPVYAWAIDHPDGTVLVDTGMIDSTPELDREWAPTLHPWPELGGVVAVINTHLHFDHCGGNRRFEGVPIHVQRAEYEAATGPDYVPEWVFFDGAAYELLEGDATLMEGISVLSTPGHSPGHQAVCVETDVGLVVLAGDVTYSMRELVGGATPAIRRIHELRPQAVWLAHASRPWLPELD
jgi:N-acyl homoserine lactone hydrolase